MRLVAVDEKRVEFRRRRPIRGTLFVGIAFVVVALAPLLVAPSIAPLRLLASGLAAALAATFLVAGWPLRERVVIHLADEVVEFGRRRRTLRGARALALRAELDEDDSPLYGVELLLEGDEKVLLIQGTDPVDVLRQFGRLLPVLRIPVESGWGLPAGVTPWVAAKAEDAPAKAHGSGTEIAVVGRFESRREVAMTVLGFGLGAASLMAFEVIARLRRGDQPTVLDIVLPILASLAVFAAGAAVLTHRVRLLDDGALVVEHRLFGRTLKSAALDKTSIHGVYPIGPPGKAQHVLFDTASGPYAIRCGDRPAVELATLIERTL